MLSSTTVRISNIVQCRTLCWWA